MRHLMSNNLKDIPIGQHLVIGANLGCFLIFFIPLKLPEIELLPHIHIRNNHSPVIVCVGRERKITDGAGCGFIICPDNASGQINGPVLFFQKGKELLQFRPHLMNNFL